MLVLPLAWGSAVEEPPALEADGARPAPDGAARPADPAASDPPSEPSVPSEPSDADATVCPDGMVQVSGEYCTDVRHACEKWLDDETLPFARCGRYRSPALCAGDRVPMTFCIDRHEHTAPGEELPQNHRSFALAARLCRSLDKRLCTEDEWNFACEGEAMLPYPYGFEREPKCNQDRTDLYEPNPKRRVLRDLREAAGARSECVSPFGVHDMVGNLDEPVMRTASHVAAPFRSALKGGWWMPGRNRCRPATTAHDEHYTGIQVGARCCADIEAPGEARPTG